MTDVDLIVERGVEAGIALLGYLLGRQLKQIDEHIKALWKRLREIEVQQAKDRERYVLLRERVRTLDGGS